MKEFDYKNSEVYFRDSFVPFSEANLSIASSPVLYGLSIYTVFNVVWNEAEQRLYIFRLRDHFKRLVNSAKILDFNSFVKEATYEKFEATMLDLLSRNHVQENVLVRVTIYIDELIAGTKIHDLTNSVSAYIYPMGQILPSNGVNVCVSSWQRTADNAIPSRAKVNGSYVNASLMKNEAILNGYDDAIAIDEHGHVAEGTVANLFLVRDGVLITPDPATDILEGITRSTILTLAKELNIPVEVRSIDRSELYMVDEAFMCGSSANVIPVLSVDRRVISTGAGEITSKISQIYEDVRAGKVPEYTSWLTPVPNA